MPAPEGHSHRMECQTLEGAARLPTANCSPQRDGGCVTLHDAVKRLEMSSRVGQMSPMMNFGQPLPHAKLTSGSLQRMHSQPQTISDMQGRPRRQPTAMPSNLVASLALPPGDDLGGVTCGVQSDSSDDEEPPCREDHLDEDNGGTAGIAPAVHHKQQPWPESANELPLARKQQTPEPMHVLADDAGWDPVHQSSPAAMGAWMHPAPTNTKAAAANAIKGPGTAGKPASGKATARKRALTTTVRQPLASGRMAQAVASGDLGAGKTAAGSGPGFAVVSPASAAPVTSPDGMAIAGASEFSTPARQSLRMGPANLPQATSMQATTAATFAPENGSLGDERAEDLKSLPGARTAQQDGFRSPDAPGQCGGTDLMAAPIGQQRTSAQLKSISRQQKQTSSSPFAAAASQGPQPQGVESSQQIFRTPAGQLRVPGPLQRIPGLQSSAKASPFASVACQSAPANTSCGPDGRRAEVHQGIGPVTMGEQQALLENEDTAQRCDSVLGAPTPWYTPVLSPLADKRNKDAANLASPLAQAAESTGKGQHSAMENPAASHLQAVACTQLDKENQLSVNHVQGHCPNAPLQTDEGLPDAGVSEPCRPHASIQQVMMADQAHYLLLPASCASDPMP